MLDAIVSRSSGSVQVNIAKRNVIEQIPLMLPKIETQRKIVEILNSIDKKIEENEEINNNLEQQAQAIYRSWFVNYEPFDGTKPDDWSDGTIDDRTIDWQKKETARAQMRKMVKRLLKKYKYPPEDYDFAISTVISQCELWTDNVEPRKEEKLYKYVSEIELSKVAEDTVSYGEKK